MFEQAKRVISEAKTIYIVGHKGPDGDAIGSSFALCYALQKIGKQASVIMPVYSESFSFLPGIETAVKQVEVPQYDVLICVDSSDPTRLAISKEDYQKAKTVVMFDHHKETDPYGDIRYVDDTKPAVSEIIYEFITAMGIPMDTTIATYIYTGLITDTGSFNYSSTKPSTLIIASRLIETGIDFSEICKKLNDTIKEAKLRLIGIAIDQMEVFFAGKLRYAYIDYETIKGLGLDEEDAEGMTNYLRMVEGTEVAVYVRGKSDGSCKVSMRSGGNVDVSKIAIAFGGGGHQRASGYTMQDPLAIGKQKLIETIGGMLS